MAGCGTRRAAGTALMAALAVAVTGCSDGNSPSGQASKAASAASSLASRASGTVASATAEAKRKLDQVKGGVDAKKDVSVGKVTTGKGNVPTAEVTAKNTTGEKKSFTVQVNFRDAKGHLQDTVIVNIDDVAAGATGRATARSHRELSGDIRAHVGTALRH
ncbi:FxLYD domain-containing protein [Streptomyces griseoluteus]|uniref:FxLYD domain-containing protein n=1 Tax=Streptomyces griseoluteus TaxID=29306 RepID=UPI0037013BE1